MLQWEQLPLEVNKKLQITGIVQGVGFRPFVYQLAERYHLNGYILNHTQGVSLEVEGEEDHIRTFIESLRRELPPLARIDILLSVISKWVGYADFKIVESETQKNKSALVSPDSAICDKCLEEMSNPSDRRYNYPFINCTDCGPRYSIIETLPYDRPNTSMHFFTMCETCYGEYMDPRDRRFHAQPISCYACGPTLQLLDTNAKMLAEGNNALAFTAQVIQKGSIVAVKGLGGFHLVCDATNTQAVKALRERKQRPMKPFAVMFKDMKMLSQCAQISAEENKLITSKEKPIVIVSKRLHTNISDLVAPGIDRIGVFLPYTPLHHLLLQELSIPLVATSANRSDEPIIRDSSELLKKLGGVVDFILDHNRAIVNANDDSVVQVVREVKMTLRMARGYAPYSIKLPFKSKKKILAIGANQKNSIAIIFEDTLILSPYIGDLNTLEAFEYFECTLESFKRFYDFEPEVIVYDRHPEYMTTKWVKALGGDIKIVEVQHHYAHLLAVMAEYQLDEKVLGFAFDGTGYGDDGTIWGSEVMIADNQHYERLYHLAPFRLLGGDKAIKEPRRVALALLFESYTLEEIQVLDLALLETFTEEEISLLHKAWQEGINAPLSSSMGRLFDAVASFADIVHLSSFEGESGLTMEQYVDRSINESFPFEVENSLIKLETMIKCMVTMEDKIKMISMFFNTMVDMIFHSGKMYPELSLVFSGGVFQNKVLTEKIIRRCKEEKRRYYFQNDTPVNDGGIALGQAWYALYDFSVQNVH